MCKRIIRLLFAIIFGQALLPYFAHAQTTSVLFDKKALLPTSPEAALISRFGDIPVGYYTGTADISIPIYTIKEAGVQIPITLSYHSSGIKVEDQATWVGLGWSLEPEGTIIQMVNGKEDFFDNTTSYLGYSYLKSREILGSYTVSTEIGEKSWTSCFTSGCYGTVDTGDAPEIINAVLEGGDQPDIYQYNFAGYSGKFYINPQTQQIVQMDKNEQIAFAKVSTTEWKATTLDGNKFIFSAKETADALSESDVTGYTWKLTQIALTNHKTIDFSYADGHYFWYGFHESWHNSYPFNLSPNGSFYNVSNLYTQHNAKTLTKISTSDIIVDFNLEDRLDINLSANENVKRLKSIDITSAVSHQKIRSFAFDYSYFPYSTVGGDFGQSVSSLPTAQLDVLGKRLKLNSLQEIGYGPDGTTTFTNPPYQFTYDVSTTLPLKVSSARDFWGYYNGHDNAALLPDLSYFYYSGLSSDPTPSNPDLTIPRNITSLNYVSANRIPDNSKATTGILKKIKYPTGGFTEFDYEPNSFANYRLPDQSLIDQTYKHNILEDHNLVADVISRQFTLKKKTILRFTNTIRNGYPVQTPAPLSYSEMTGASISLTKVTFPGGANTTPHFTILKSWDLSMITHVDFDNNHGATWTEDVTVDYDPDPNCYFVVTTTLPDALGSQGSSTKVAYVQSDFNYYDQDGVDLTSHQCGVRVKAIRSYTNEGTIASNKIIKYINEDGNTSGKLMSPLQLLSQRVLWFGISNNDGTCETIDNDGWVSFVSSESYSGGGGNPVGYSRVEEINLAPDGSSNGKHVYNYINEESQSIVNASVPDIPYLRDGLLSSDVIFNAAGDKLAETSYSYVDIDDVVSGLTHPNFSGVKILSNWVGLDQCAGGSNLMDSLPSAKYMIYYYPIITEWNKLSSKESKQYDPANNRLIATTETYTYNRLGQILAATTTDSKQQSIAQTTLYPIDDASGSNETAVLLFNKLYNRPIDQRKLVNGVEVNKTHYDYWYKFINTPDQIVVPTLIQSSNNQQPLYNNVSFENYDNRENILQFTQSGIPTALIWSDSKGFIIAETVNASSNEVAYTSFESDGKGNWTFSGTPTGDGTAPAGSSSYSLSGGDITKSGLNSTANYIVSYWSKNGQQSVSGTSAVTIGRSFGNWTYYEHAVSNPAGGQVTISGTGTIDELRLYPKAAQMNSYTYNPLVGISSKCDPSSHISYYEYDVFGRLKLIRDQNNNIVKAFEYKYAGQ